MDIKETRISGLYEIENFRATDKRGEFVKTFNHANFKGNNIEVNFHESYYSTSKKGVIRGMHFQTPPKDHNKLVYVVKGEILDVVLDLRMNSKTYGKCFSIKLKEFGSSLYIPKGMAHGFLSLTEESIVVYNVSSVYDSVYDKGILWDSFEFKWGQSGNQNLVISERDLGFPSLKDFKSPF